MTDDSETAAPPAGPNASPNGSPPGGDGTQSAGAAASPGPSPAIAPITVVAQYLKDLSFENPTAPAHVLRQDAPQGRVEVDVRARNLGETNYEVVLIVRAEARRDNDVLFLVELEYAGIFSLFNVPQEAVEPVLLIECPRLLLPFARQIIANATQDGGFAPMLINPIDFVGLYRQQRLNRPDEARV